MNTVVAVDVGGTFTDIVVLDRSTAEARFGKVPTTPVNPAEGVLAACDALDVQLGEVGAFLHGSTIGLNSLLERKGRVVGLLTTKGFRDVLQIGRMTWPMYRLHWKQPEPLVPRYLRLEVDERTLADGSIDRPLNHRDVVTAGASLLQQGAEALAVCLLHSYVNPQHEELCGEILRREFPGVDVALSHTVTREYREYERTATTVVDAALKPIISRYLRELEQHLQTRGFHGSLLITRCDGGVMNVDEACERTIRTLVSGPASGVMGAAALARMLGEPRVIACDMGGTSFDAALILDGEPQLESISYVEGIPLLMPIVAMTAIGAGGGSIAWVDDGGALNFGPQSAGAVPGPVCYGRGGRQVTFTDAAVVSGLIDPEYFLGGGLRLDASRARTAIEEQLVRPLKLATVDDGASGIVDLAESKMAAALESITIDKGLDPRDFVLLAYGGGGPIAAGGLARRLEIPRVIIPESPGTFSARGMTTLDLVHDFARTSITTEASIGKILASVFDELEESGRDALDREGAPKDAQHFQRYVDARYENQEHTISIGLSLEDRTGNSSSAIRNAFDQRHEALYSFRLSDPIEATAFRLRASGRRAVPIARDLQASQRSDGPLVKSHRVASHRQTGHQVLWAVFERSSLAPGDHIQGPAIVEEPSATTLVHDGQQVEVDRHGNLILRAGTTS